MILFQSWLFNIRITVTPNKIPELSFRGIAKFFMFKFRLIGDSAGLVEGSPNCISKFLTQYYNCGHVSSDWKIGIPSGLHFVRSLASVQELLSILE